jgi:iron complex transport system substrate-binding protein
MLQLLGAVCGCEDQAQALVDYYEQIVNEVTALTANVERPSVYLCGDATYLRSCTGGMYQREMIEMAGGTCVSAQLDGSTWADISAEQLLTWNPDDVFAVSYAQYTLDDILSDAALGALTAVEDQAVYMVPSSIEAWDYPQPSSILGLLWMTHILHPELISQEDYMARAQEFYSTYFGLDVTAQQLGL